MTVDDFVRLTCGFVCLTELPPVWRADGSFGVPFRHDEHDGTGVLVRSEVVGPLVWMCIR